MGKDRESKYLITGATGFIGSLIIKQLQSREEKNKITIIARNLNKAMAMYENSNINIIQADITNQITMQEITDQFDYIIHCASETKSVQMIKYPVETANIILNGTKNILELARRCQVKSLVYLSSMEVYGQVPDNGERISEDVMGYIDVLSARSCYPLGKRMAENLCFSYYKEYNVPVKIARLAQTFGSGVLQEESRVFVQFANAVRHHKDIVMHTEGNSVGNYCDSIEAVEALFLLLSNGENGEAYNVVNESTTMTISEMAKLVAEKIANNSIEVKYEIPDNATGTYGYAAPTGLRLSSSKLQSLGWKPKADLEDMYRSMISWMNDRGFQ